MRVALLGYRSNPYSGGQGVYLRYIARALRDQGHAVSVISGQPYPELDAGIELIKLPSLNLFQHAVPAHGWHAGILRSWTDTLEYLSVLTGGFPEPYTFGRRVARYLHANRHAFDVIHDNQSLSWGILELQNLGIPVVTTIHHPITFDRDIALANCDDWRLRLLIRRWHAFLRMQAKVAKRLKCIITVSERSKADISAAFGVAAGRITVVHNGVDTQVFNPAGRCPDASRIISTASADQPLKGSQHLLRAFARTLESHRDLRLTFVGKPKPGGDTEALIAQLGIRQHIDFVHDLKVEDIAALYAQAAIAVVPSEYEGFGLPAVEAMACGVPVIASDGGALPEVVGNAGIIVPRGDVDALNRAMCRVLDDEEKRKEMSELGTRRVASCFTWDRAAASLEEIYMKLLSEAST